MEAGESKRSSSPISPITIRAPGWFRTLYVGSFVAWVVLASILLFVGHSELTSVISLMFWVSAAATLPVAVACSIQRLEYVGNNVVLVRLFRRIECPPGLNFHAALSGKQWDVFLRLPQTRRHTD